MFKIERKLAHEISLGDLSLNPKKWLSEEVNELATKFPGFDDMPFWSISVLGQVSAIGPSTKKALVCATCLELKAVEECLEALTEYKFVMECRATYEANDEATYKETLEVNNELTYEATINGRMAFRSIGTNLIRRKKFELKGKYEALCRLDEGIAAMWHE
jgi:hypothetical protein